MRTLLRGGLCAAVCVVGAVGGGCITVISVDHKTALERQVIGTYEDLGAEVMMLASVRAEEPPLPDPKPKDQEEEALDPAVERAQTREGQVKYEAALHGRRVELYLRDDVVDLTEQGCLDELETGFIAGRDCDAAVDVATKLRIDRVVEEINAARRAIVDYIIYIYPDLGPEHRAQVMATLHELKKRGQGER